MKAHSQEGRMSPLPLITIHDDCSPLKRAADGVSMFLRFKPAQFFGGLPLKTTHTIPKEDMHYEYPVRLYDSDVGN